MDFRYSELLNTLTCFKSDDGLVVLNVDSVSLVRLLAELDVDFKAFNMSAHINKVTCTLIGHNKSFFSNVFQVVVEYTSQGQSFTYECVLKIPLVDSLGKENRQSIINCHNVECEFYENFKDFHLSPRVFSSIKFGSNGQNFGLILMESFVGRAESLDLYAEIRDTQILNSVRSLANFQFYARDPERRKWWMHKKDTISLDAMYSNLIPTYYPRMAKRKGFAPLIGLLKPLLTHKFGVYALRELPQKYNAITICHGDFQSHNLMFEKEADGIGDKLVSIIDWQLIFFGSSLYDIGKLLGMACNELTRMRMYLPAFEAYFDELDRLYKSSNLLAPFTREQGFELYELIVCHIATMMIEWIGYVEEKYENCPEWTNKIEILEERGLRVVEFVIPLIKKYGLERFDQADNLL